VPFTKRVKISSTNVRLETTVPRKEETFQVVIDLIKNSKCFKAFTISADVLEIFMQQIWYTIKKVQGTYSYEFLLTNKKCVVNADVFRMILDSCLRVKVIDFTDVPDDDATLAFLIELGYKGPLYKHTNMFVDHMHRPWRTLAAIINKCLYRKTEDLAFLIDRRKEKRSRHKNTSFPRFTKIINYFLKQHNSFFNLKYQHYHTIKDDGIVSRGKGSQGKKTTDTHVADVDVSEELDPKPPKRKTASTRVVKKKVINFVDDNIIFDDPNVALELGKVTFDPLKRLKGVPSLTLEEQEAVDTMQALKQSRKTNKRQPGIRGSNEGTSTTPRVPNESTFIYATSSDGTEDQLDDEEKDDKDGDADDKGDDHISDTQDDDEDEDAKTKSDDTTEVDVSSLMDIHIQQKTPQIQSPSVQKVLVSVIPKTTNLPPIPKILTETSVSIVISSPHVTPTILTMQQTSTPIPTPPITIDASIITSAVPESEALFTVQLRVAKL
nr:hypothetical protein [Tanacetum cinerariifolium]